MSGFHDVRFPDDIAYGSAGGPGFRTDVIELVTSGHEARVSHWAGSKSRYNAAYGIRTPQQLANVQRFIRARQGSAYSFRFKDFLDFHTDPDDPTYQSAPGERDQPVSPEVGDGTETQFQLVKKYTSGLASVNRPITLPVDGTITVWLDGVEQTEGVDFTISSGGKIDFMVAPDVGVVPEWSGEFDVRVRFERSAEEALKASIDSFDSGSIPDIGLVEELDAEPGHISDYFYGGSVSREFGADFVVSTSDGFLYSVEATDAGLALHLEDPSAVPDGGLHFAVVNRGAESFALKDDGGSTLVAAIAANEGVLVLAAKAAGGGNEWIVLGTLLGGEG